MSLRRRFCHNILSSPYLCFYIIAIANFIILISTFFFSRSPLSTKMSQVLNGSSLSREIREAEVEVADNSVYVDHSVPQHHPTHLQRTLLIAYALIVCLWIIRRVFAKANIISWNANDAPSQSLVKHKSDIELQSLENGIESKNQFANNVLETSRESDARYDKINENDSSVLGVDSTTLQNKGASTFVKMGVVENVKDRLASGASASTTQASGQGGQGGQGPETGRQDAKRTATQTAPTGGPPVVSLDQFLNKAVLFGAIMIYFYLCDYLKVFPQGYRQYSRDTFLFLIFLLFLVAFCFTLKSNQDKILNREQTEEWKGWMQVMFVWYHYFRAKEWYNWIRVYIACYVWMTGFGNFSFFWVRKDFSLWRMLKMLFRLNFLVIFVTLVTNNEYMLYYICAMHTYWFLSVYVFMRVLNSWNTDRIKMAAKFAAYAICNAIVFDIPGVSENVFRPLQFILGLHDKSGDVMHEWSFRVGLDHWACFLGMLCAYNYPTVEKFSAYLDSVSSSENERVKKLVIRIVIGVTATWAGVLWYFTFMRKEKYAYNALHPYSAMIPIVSFIVLRNLHPTIRVYHLGMLSWLGKITLETYLSQLHIYLLANATSLVVYIPGYPLLNFALATFIYLLLSHCLFTITNDSSTFLIPKDHKKLALNVGYTVALFVVSGLMAFGISI